MSIIVKDFPNRKIMKREKEKMHGQKFEVLHTDFIDNKFKVTFVDGDDRPENSPENKEINLQLKLIELLVKSIENDTITWEDYKILQRLERGLELKQSTVDKLIIVKQGGLAGIFQRLKNLFNL